MGAVRSCRCKDKHNLLSGQQSAAINFPRSPHRRFRFCCPFAVPFAVPLRGRRRTALRLPPSACRPPPCRPPPCRPPPCRPPPCRPPTYCLPHAPFSASLSFVPASISACPFLPSPACRPSPARRLFSPAHPVAVLFLTSVPAPALSCRLRRSPPPVVLLVLLVLLVLPVTILFLFSVPAPPLRTVAVLPASSQPRAPVLPVPLLLLVTILSPPRGLSPGCPKFRESGVISPPGCCGRGFFCYICMAVCEGRKI